MYLETILSIPRRKNAVRPVDVGEYTGFSKPSVNRAVGLLREGGYRVMKPGGEFVLADAGQEKAEQIGERHTALSALLVRFGVDEITASEDACRIEHVFSDRSFDAIKLHMQKYTK